MASPPAPPSHPDESSSETSSSSSSSSSSSETSSSSSSSSSSSTSSTTSSCSTQSILKLPPLSSLSEDSFTPNELLIRAGYEIVYQFPFKTPVLLLLQTRPEWHSTLLGSDEVVVTDGEGKAVELEQKEVLIDAFGNRCTRLMAPAGTLKLSCDVVIKESPSVLGKPCKNWGIWPSCAAEAGEEELEPPCQHAVESLPAETLQFLFGSRYCEVDLLSNFAWQTFGSVAPGWARVEAINNWVHNNVTFGYEHANPLKTAYGVFLDRKGVCRDFAHLALTLCRCLNIPARYAFGYLGDIDCEPDGYPPDFSACYQVYLGGRWRLFDARHGVHRIGWILLAVGRDQADCCFTTSFGAHSLLKFAVHTLRV